jgi:predicted nucleic acid-binding protein
VGIAAWLEAQRIKTLWDMPPAVWEKAGLAFRRYAPMRLEAKLPRRIVADFLIAAHAQYHGLRVLTFDSVVYRAVFDGILA